MAFLPVTTGLPAPAGFPLPQPDPQTFGLTPYERRSPLGLFLPSETQTQAPVANDYMSRMAQTLFPTLSAGAADGTLSLGDAQAQTDAALARIASVNPELAQQLSVQRGEEPDDPGFFGRILQTVASSPIGKALELVSRPARIIPEILTDSDESVWKNIGDALSGHSDATMGDFLAKYNVFQGDDIFSKIARMGTSFFLDIAVDPTTYLTAGLGSVGRAAATRYGSKLAAKAVFWEKGMSVMDNLAAKVGNEALGVAANATTEELRAAAFEHFWKAVTDPRSSIARIAKIGSVAEDLSITHPDFIGGVIGMGLRDADSALALQAIKSADEAHKLIGKFGLNRIGEKMLGEIGVDKGVMQGLLGEAKKTGAFGWGAGARDAYMAARYAGALEGGLRFSLPGIRIITPALWGTSKLDFSIARRFFSGLSGQMRLMHAAERGLLEPKTVLEALEVATEFGWRGVAEKFPAIAQHFGGLGGRLGSAFAKASWQLGGITRNVGSFALVRGGGLGTALSADARKSLRSMKKTLASEAMTLDGSTPESRRVLDELLEKHQAIDIVGDVIKRKGKGGSGVLSAPETQRTLHELHRAATAATGDDTLVIRALELLPTLQAQEIGAERWWNLVEANAQQLGLPEEELAARLKWIDTRRKAAIEVEKKMAESPEAQMATKIYRLASDQTAARYREMGGSVANATIRTEAEPAIHPANRSTVDTGHAVQQGRDYELVAGAVEHAEAPGFGPQHIVDGPDGRGYVFEEVKPSDTPFGPEPPPRRELPDTGPDGGGGGTPPPSGGPAPAPVSAYDEELARIEQELAAIQNVPGKGEDVKRLIRERRALETNKAALDNPVSTTPPPPPAHEVDVQITGKQVMAQVVDDAEAGTAKGYVKAELTNEGNIVVQSASTSPAFRRQGVASSIYQKLAEEAKARGGTLISDGGEAAGGMGYRTPAAEKMWNGFREKGYPVVFHPDRNEWEWSAAAAKEVNFKSEVPTEVMDQIDEFMGGHFAKGNAGEKIHPDSPIVQEAKAHFGEENVVVTEAGIGPHGELTTFNVPAETPVGSIVIFGGDNADEPLFGVVKSIDPNDPRLKYGNDVMPEKAAAIAATEGAPAKDLPLAYDDGENLLLLEGNHRRATAVQNGDTSMNYVEVSPRNNLRMELPPTEGTAARRVIDNPELQAELERIGQMPLRDWVKEVDNNGRLIDREGAQWSSAEDFKSEVSHRSGRDLPQENTSLVDTDMGNGVTKHTFDEGDGPQVTYVLTDEEGPAAMFHFYPREDGSIDSSSILIGSRPGTAGKDVTDKLMAKVMADLGDEQLLKSIVGSDAEGLYMTTKGAAYVHKRIKAALAGASEAPEDFATKLRKLKEEASKPANLPETKVVDEGGKPLSVYHGAPRPVDKLTVDKSRDNVMLARGLYFAEDPNVANKYSEGYSQGFGATEAPNVHAVNLDIRNPFDASVEHPAEEMNSLIHEVRAAEEAEATRLGIMQDVRKELIDSDYGEETLDELLSDPEQGMWELHAATPDMLSNITPPGSDKDLWTEITDEMDRVEAELGKDVYTIANSADDLEKRYVDLYMRTYLREARKIYPEKFAGLTSDSFKNSYLWVDDLIDFEPGTMVPGRKFFEKGASGATATDVLRARGYDGVFHIGKEDGRVWIAFDESQVKPRGGPSAETPEITSPIPGVIQQGDNIMVSEGIAEQSDLIDEAIADGRAVWTDEGYKPSPGNEFDPVFDGLPGIEDIRARVGAETGPKIAKDVTKIPEAGPEQMRLGDWVYDPQHEPDAQIRALAGMFDVPAENLDMIDQFAEIEALDPKWAHILGPNTDIHNLPDGVDMQYWEAKLESIDAWHDSKWAGDPEYMAYKDQAKGLDAGQKEELATQIFGDPIEGGWSKVTPTDYLEIMGPGALDAEMAALDEIIGRHLGIISPDEARFRDIVGKTFRNEPKNDMEALREQLGLNPLKSDKWEQPDVMMAGELKKAQDPIVFLDPEGTTWNMHGGSPEAFRERILREGQQEKVRIAYDEDTGEYVVIDGHHRTIAMHDDEPLDVEWIPDKELVEASRWAASQENLPPLRRLTKKEGFGNETEAISDKLPQEEMKHLGESGIHGKPRKKAVLALKNPVIIDEDEVAKIAAGQRPLSNTGVIDITQQADEYVAKTLELFNEKWNPQIRQILDSEKFDALRPEVQAILEEMGLDPAGMTDEMARIALESQDEIAARLRTQFYEDQGYDGIIRIKDGRQKVTVFPGKVKEGQKPPIWQLSENAPVLMPEQGYFHRRITSEVAEMLEGNVGQGEKRAPRDWDAHFTRDTKDLNFAEAENHIRGQLRDMGMNIPDDMPILERDVSANLAAYVDGMANDMGNVFLGREAKRLQAMGLTRSPFAGRFLGPKYEATPSIAYLNTGNWLQRQSEELWRLSQKVARHQTKIIKENAKPIQRIEQTINLLNERVHAAIDEEAGKTFRAIFKDLDPNGMGAREAAQYADQIGGDLTELRKFARETSFSPEGAEVFRARAQSLLEPDEIRPGLSKQIAGREAELDALRRELDWHTNVMTDVTEEWNRIAFEAQARVAEPKVALEMGDPSHVGMGKVLVPGLEEMYMPAVMADEFNMAARGFKHLNEFQKTWRRFLSLWKEWATWAWPGFHVRNAMGGWFNNWLGGVEFNDYVEMFRVMRARRENEKGLAANWSKKKLSREFINRHGLTDLFFGMEPTYSDLGNLMSKYGINSANSRSFGEARIGAELLDKEMSKPASSPWTLIDTAFGKSTKAGLPGRKIASSLRGTGEMVENMLRGASFLQGMKQTNGDIMGAHMFTMMRHGDYGDLSDWEYGAIRDVIPFYKWMRTNTPLQIHQLFEQPGKITAVIHAKDALWEASGLDKEDARAKMPSWALQGLAFPGPGSTEDAINMVTMDLPMNDLYQGAGEFFSQMVPLARPFLESYVTEKSLFTGKPIEGAPVKVDWVSDVPFLGKMLQGIGIGKVGPDGKSYFIDDKLQNVLGVVPVVSRFRNWIYEEPNRTKLRSSTLISAAAGLGIRQFGEADFTSAELNFYYSQVIPAIEHLKEMGYPLPTTEDLNNMYGASNNVLLAAGITPKAGV